jgi:hypothetical protein
MRPARVVLAAALLALTGCGIGNPWPSVPPKVSGTIAVTLFGDSLTRGTGPSLHDALAFDGQANTVDDKSVIGGGLANPAAHEYIVANLPASGVVVFEFLGICVFCAYEYGSPEFYAAWEDQMRLEITTARDAGLRVVWVKPPPVTNPFIAPVAATLSSMVDRVTRELGVVEADWSTALTDVDGAYQADLFYAPVLAGPGLYTVRETDGVHLPDAGRRRVAAWTAAAVMTAAA